MLSLAVVTADSEIVHRVQHLASEGATLTVASDPVAAAELVAAHDQDVLLVDLSNPALLPKAGLLSRVTRGLVLIQKTRGGPPQITAYEPSEVAQAIERIRRMARRRKRSATGAILGDAPIMAQLREQIAKVASFPDVSVLVLGETGTGKELVAQAIHESTCGAERPFVAINCAAIPEALLESELFGHQSGAFTGATGSKPGLLEAARYGTLFLDEIGEMPLALQPKLLRVLESRTFRRVGSNATLPFEARVVSATNRPPSGATPSGLRPDLFYRLGGLKLSLPPLRERIEDVPLLVEHFLESFAERNRVAPQSITTDAVVLLQSHAWPGNARELRCIVEHAAIVADGARVEGKHVETAFQSQRTWSGSARSATPRAPLRAVEQGMIEKAFKQHRGNVSRAAAELGISRSTLRDKLRRYGLVRGGEGCGS
jgi:DNA-binding NtrC family response regulator